MSHAEAGNIPDEYNAIKDFGVAQHDFSSVVESFARLFHRQSTDCLDQIPLQPLLDRIGIGSGMGCGVARVSVLGACLPCPVPFFHLGGKRA